MIVYLIWACSCYSSIQKLGISITANKEEKKEKKKKVKQACKKANISKKGMVLTLPLIKWLQSSKVLLPEALQLQAIQNT